ncbi:hypothetical protein K8I28_15395, partial [bacterium]|nr:hypothetical protein [bacterium]
EGYYRWRCYKKQFPKIINKLVLRYNLELNRPARSNSIRPSCFELRIQFRTALTTGNRGEAEKAIDLLDKYELDSALNTQMMKIKMWHHFREFNRIESFHNLPALLSLPDLPPPIDNYIRDALKEDPSTITKIQDCHGDYNKSLHEEIWDSWFYSLIETKDSNEARNTLERIDSTSADTLNSELVELYTKGWNDLILLNDFLLANKSLINEGLITFIDKFVREQDFPKRNYADLYLAILRLWCELNSGVSINRELGHILLELACALLQLNHEIDEIKTILEFWWSSRPVPAQLPFVLDAIELLSNHHPDKQAASNLWIEAASLANRNIGEILQSEKKLWCEVGRKIGFDNDTINEFFPEEIAFEPEDILCNANLNKISIICMRKEQAQSAAKQIEKRTSTDVSIITSKVAGTETDNAKTADVIILVWMATTHAVFRALDGVDRKRIAYVQGTGESSIVRALERWCKANRK